MLNLNFGILESSSLISLVDASCLGTCAGVFGDSFPSLMCYFLYSTESPLIAADEVALYSTTKFTGPKRYCAIAQHLNLV